MANYARTPAWPGHPRHGFSSPTWCTAIPVCAWLGNQTPLAVTDFHGPTPLAPTVVLVHGAFTDASSWAGVTPLLLAAGLAVRAPANPLRGLAQDAAYIKSVVRDIDDPVVLAGHGYGGAVTTQAATDADNVVALCYVAALRLDAGECVLDITNRFAPMPVTDATFIATLPAQLPGGPESELYIRKERFPQVYARTGTAPGSVTHRPGTSWASGWSPRSSPCSWPSPLCPPRFTRCTSARTDSGRSSSRSSSPRTRSACS